MALRRFAGLSEQPVSELARVAAHVRERFYRAGEELFSDREPLDRITLVVEGQVATYRRGYLLRTAASGETVGSITAMSLERKGLRAVALADTTTFEVAADVMVELLEDNFPMLLSTMSALAGHMIELRVQAGQGGGFEVEPPDTEEAPANLDFVQRLFYLHRTVPLFESRLDALGELARGVVELRHEPGTLLWREGDPSVELLVMVRGEITASTKAGQRFVFRGGDLVGGLDTMARVPRWFTAEVTQPLVALEVDQELFLDLVEDNPDLGLGLIRGLSSGIEALYERLAGYETMAITRARS